MRILLLGDFGGSFPKKLEQAIKKEDFQFVLCNGDLGDIKEIRKIFFKFGEHFEKKMTKQGLKNLDKIRIKGLEASKKPLKILNSLGKPVFLVSGNNETRMRTRFLKIVSKHKNIVFIDKKPAKFKGINIIGSRSNHRLIEEIDQLTRKSLEEKLKNIVDKNMKHLDHKKTIFLAHDPPYNCKVDKLPANNPLNPNKHVGSKVNSYAIKKYKFPIMVCGHLEEFQEECKLDSTRVINPGAAELSKYAILEINKDLKKSKIIFKQI